jgi:hypothetical protein
MVNDFIVRRIEILGMWNESDKEIQTRKNLMIFIEIIANNMIYITIAIHNSTVRDQ